MAKLGHVMSPGKSIATHRRKIISIYFTIYFFILLFPLELFKGVLKKF